jgi:hypothetical protein
MNSPVSVPPGTAMSRLKERLRHPWSHTGIDVATSPATAVVPLMLGRQTGFPASIAEFLLVFRLRVRRSSVSSTDVMERAVRMVLVTCQHWFAEADRQKTGPRRRC